MIGVLISVQEYTKELKIFECEHHLGEDWSKVLKPGTYKNPSPEQCTRLGAKPSVIMRIPVLAVTWPVFLVLKYGKRRASMERFN